MTPLGQRAAHFHNFWLLWTCTIISVFVLALLLWTIFRFRRGANPTPSRNSHNTLIEVVWTLVPVLILVAIALPSIRLLRDQYTPPPADLTVKVIGNQWYWSYQYPDNGGSESSATCSRRRTTRLKPGDRFAPTPTGRRCSPPTSGMVIPAGKVVKFIITADDVIHSFAVPAFWTKLDANPGRLNETWVKVDRPGVYFGQCSELCGARHGYMPIAVEVVRRPSSTHGSRRRAAPCPAPSQPRPTGTATAAAAAAATGGDRRRRQPNRPRPTRPRPRRIRSEDEFSR